MQWSKSQLNAHKNQADPFCTLWLFHTLQKDWTWFDNKCTTLSIILYNRQVHKIPITSNDWNSQNHSAQSKSTLPDALPKPISYAWSLTICDWESQNGALWDTNLHALYQILYFNIHDHVGWLLSIIPCLIDCRLKRSHLDYSGVAEQSFLLCSTRTSRYSKIAK